MALRTNNKNAAGPVPFQIDPGQLPDDGSSVTFEQTFAKKLGPVVGSSNQLTEEDVKHSDWAIELLDQRTGKWSTIEMVRGRPHAPQLLDRGAGRYRITPYRNGEPIETMRKELNVGEPSALPAPSPEPAPAPREESSAMDPFMRMLMQQQAEASARQAEERAEMRRQATEDKRTREAWERTQDLKAEAKRESDERRAEALAERQAQERREAADRNQALILAGLELARGFTAQRAAPVAPPREDRVQELLLTHVLRERNQPPASPASSLQDTLQIVQALDTMVQSRADRLPPPEKDEEDDSLSGMMMNLLPFITGGRGQAQGASAQGAPAQPNIEAVLGRVMGDPAAMAVLIKRDPRTIARTLSRVLHDNPELQEIVADVMAEEDAKDEAAT